MTPTDEMLATLSDAEGGSATGDGTARTASLPRVRLPFSTPSSVYPQPVDTGRRWVELCRLRLPLPASMIDRIARLVASAYPDLEIWVSEEEDYDGVVIGYWTDVQQ